MPTYAEQLAGKTLQQRAAMKADWLQKAVAAAAGGKTYTWQDGELTITVSNPQLLTGGFAVDVSAARNGQALALNNPYRFWNPPVAVWRDGQVKEDLIAALKAMIADAVR